MTRFCLLLVGSFISMGSMLWAQDIFVSTSGNNLYRVDMSDCSYTQVGVVPGSTTDISFHPNGRLYSLNSQGSLFEVDFLTGNFILIHTFEAMRSQLYTALTISGDGVFYACGIAGQLWSYDLDSGIGTFLGNVGAGAEGDLAFNNGELYMAATGDDIVRIDLDDVTRSEVVIDDDLPGVRIFGIVTSAETCEDIQTYAMTNETAQVFLVDFENNDLTPFCQIPLQVTGGASTFEFFGSAPVIIDTVLTDDFSCIDASGQINVFAGGGIGVLQYSIDGSNYQSSSQFTSLSSNVDSVYVIDEVGCEVREAVDLSSLQPLITLVETTPPSCGEANGEISIAITGGSGNYNLDFNGQMLLVDEATFFDVAPGIYTAEVSDSEGCLAEPLIIELVEILPLSAELSALTPATCGENNGTAQISLTGGQGPFLFSVNGGDPQADSLFQQLAPGMYEYDVLDALGCSASSVFEITAEGEFMLELVEQQQPACGREDGLIIVQVSGAALATISVNGEAESLGPVSIVGQAGRYQFIGESPEGCLDTLNVELINQGTLVFSEDIRIVPSSCNEPTGQIVYELLTDFSKVDFRLNGIPIVATEGIISEVGPGSYELIAESESCADTLTVLVPSEDCPVYIPDAFSPNLDGYNDTFGPQGQPGIGAMVRSFRIFDRWGGIVFERFDLPLGDSDLFWDGFRQNRMVSQGIYVYILELEYTSGNRANLSGDVLLVQ